MDQFKNRKWVKIISIADVALSCCTITILVIVILYAIFFTSGVEQAAANTADVEVIEQTSTILTIIWIIIVILIIVEAVKIVAALKLLKASKIETAPSEAYKLCKFWRNLNAFFLLINVFNSFAGYKTSIVVIIMYSVCLFVVHGYMQELLAFEGIPNSQPVMMTEGNVEVVVTRKDGPEAPPTYKDVVNQQPPQWT